MRTPGRSQVIRLALSGFVEGDLDEIASYIAQDNLPRYPRKCTRIHSANVLSLIFPSANPRIVTTHSASLARN